MAQQKRPRALHKPGASLDVDVVGELSNPLAVSISLTGIDFPSVNEREIGVREIRNGSRIIKKRYSKRTKAANAKLQVITDLYSNALKANGYLPVPTFADTPVTVIVFVAEKKRRFDSHNYPKAIADWLEHVGLINDDSRAEVLAFKRSDYAFGAPLNEASVLIAPRYRVEDITQIFMQTFFARCYQNPFQSTANDFRR